MDWQLVYTETRVFPDSPFLLPISLNYPAPVIRMLPQTDPIRPWAGWMIPFVNYPGIGRVEQKWERIWFGTKTVGFDVDVFPFELEFKSAGTSIGMILSIWERPSVIAPESSIEFL
jgi:hypothetical protein